MVEGIYNLGKQIINDINGRHTGRIVNRNCCGRNTNEFVRFNKEHISGSWSGPCGV